MKLSDAVALLASQGRYFSEVYKLYNFRDDQLLKDYLDFIVHEPVEWMKGFPAKHMTLNSFSRPKSAVIKLLKAPEVSTVLGAEYVEGVRDIIWKTYKAHAEAIVSHRQSRAQVPRQAQDETQSQGEEVQGEEIQSEGQQEHMAEVKEHVGVEGIVYNERIDWERKYRVLECVVSDLIREYALIAPGLSSAALMLLQSYSPQP